MDQKQGDGQFGPSILGGLHGGVTGAGCIVFVHRCGSSWNHGWGVGSAVTGGAVDAAGTGGGALSVNVVGSTACSLHGWGGGFWEGGTTDGGGWGGNASVATGNGVTNTSGGLGIAGGTNVYVGRTGTKTHCLLGSC
jgi:hypothetical protein